MSNEIEAIKDPGLPAHVHRRADTDPKAAKKAEPISAICCRNSSLNRRLSFYP
jgi:ubiquinol-cytochrome c reductase iron-sulfur subunit